MANDGTPFGSTNFHSLMDLGLSDKSAGEGIGNKGLGFRSVLRLSDRPEIYSRDPDDVADRAFSGYSFRFPTAEELITLTRDGQLGSRLGSEASPLDFPIPAVASDHEVLRFAASGFATVVKLPLRDRAAAADAQRQIERLASAEAPILLFLSRISSLELKVCLPGENGETVTLTRTDTPSLLLADGLRWVRDVDLGSQGQYLLARCATSPELMRDAIRRSTAARQVDTRWLDWDGEAWVGVALRLDKPLESGLIYTFLPTQATSPLAAHIHAPFFTRLARRDLDLDVPLNHYLMEQIAAACIELIRTLRDAGDHSTVAPLVVDLVAWTPPHHEFLVRACSQGGSSLHSERTVPVAGTSSWSSLEEAYWWPVRSDALSVFSAGAVAALGHPIADPLLGTIRLSRLAALHFALIRVGMEPDSETLATWAESLTRSMRSRQVGFATWSDLYDDLAAAFSPLEARALRGRKIILDQDSRLRPAMGAEDDARRGPGLFFSPSVDDEGADTTGAKLPRAFARQVAYTYPDIPWNVRGPVRRRRPGRIFLEASGLVREYRTDRLLEVVRDVLARRPSQSQRVAALVFGCALYPTLNEAQRTVLAGVPFTVPTVDGRWLPASEAAFSLPWGTEGGVLIERLLGLVTGSSSSLRSVSGRLLVGPSGWPAPVDDRGGWQSFLSAIGVHDGLPLVRVPLEARSGYQLQPSDLSTELGLPSSLGEAWSEDVSQGWRRGNYPYTRYRFSSRIAILPGACDVEVLGDEAREVYARLLARGLTQWSADTLEVTVSRAERRTDQQDVHRWPTPVSSYLRHSAWLPIEGTEDDATGFTFASPADAWLPGSGQLPRFVPPIVHSVRTVVAQGEALRRLQEFGIRFWDEPRHSGHVLRKLPQLLEDGHVPSHDAGSFKKQCRQAWSHLVDHPDQWPWQSQETPTVVVTEGGQLRARALDSGTTVFVPDETDQAKQALIGLTAHPVLVSDPALGQSVAGLIAGHEMAVMPTSGVSVEVFGDDQLIAADIALPALLAEGRQWVATVVALVAELKAGSFVRHTEQSISQLIERLRRTRFVRVASVRLVLGGTEVDPPEQTSSVAIEDDTAPTIVLWVGGGTIFEQLERCAGSIADLIRQPQLTAELQLAFSRLGRLGLPTTPMLVEDQALAQALQVSEAEIRESRADLRGPLFDVLDRVRVLLVYFCGVGAMREFDALVRDASDDEAVTEALAAWSGVLPEAAPDLVAICESHSRFAELRDALKLDFRRFNDALAGTEPSHPPLSHPELHREAVDQFVHAHQAAIADRLRAAYLPVALAGGDLTRYGEARNLEGIEADPAWLHVCASPSGELVAGQVGRWLAAHGASMDLDSASELVGVSELRSRNFEHLDQLVQGADLRLRAWSQKNGTVPPGGWNAPMIGARSALESSFRADFSVLSEVQLLELILDAVGWPDQMPRTLDLASLGLDSSDLVPRDEAEASDRARRQYERAHLQLDGREVSVESEQLGSLADTVTAGLSEELLTQTGKVTLAQISSHRARELRQSGQGLTIALGPKLSDQQRTGVGLIGEVIARAWLERRYGEVEWLSGYRNIVLGDSAGSDSLGYDFAVRHSGRKPLFFEVKAVVGEALETAEFNLGETEVVAAQQYQNFYHILLVCSALDSQSRRILELPNPLGRRGAGRYTLVGRGLRYRCSPVIV